MQWRRISQAIYTPHPESFALEHSQERTIVPVENKLEAAIIAGRWRL
jgi:hypothetical protein